LFRARGTAGRSSRPNGVDDVAETVNGEPAFPYVAIRGADGFAAGVWSGGRPGAPLRRPVDDRAALPRGAESLIAVLADESNIVAIDSPVSGGCRQEPKNGTLAMMWLSAPRAEFEMLQPVAGNARFDRACGRRRTVGSRR